MLVENEIIIIFFLSFVRIVRILKYAVQVTSGKTLKARAEIYSQCFPNRKTSRKHVKEHRVFLKLKEAILKLLIKAHQADFGFSRHHSTGILDTGEEPKTQSDGLRLYHNASPSPKNI